MTNTLHSAVEHLYVHVPFCDGKCDYCAFYSVVANPLLCHEYALLPGRELGMMLGRDVKDIPGPRTIYFGGGTPTILGEEDLCVLVDGLRKVVALDGVEEWTVEANPASVTRAIAGTLRSLGVNRISIGAQCFDDGVLRAIGRRHTAADVLHAVSAARDAGFENIGLDLIAGLPGLTEEAWRTSLSRTIEMGMRHVSVYALGVEAGTALHRRVANGQMALPGANAQLEALAVAERMLGDAGLARYEISNFARPGSECRHNLACWRGEDYMGLGPSASSRAGLQRWTNRADASGYLARLRNNTCPPRGEETCDAETDAAERLIFAFRLSEGVDLDAFAARYPVAAPRLPEWRHTLERLHKQGVMESMAGGGWRLTARGREVADAAIEALL